MLVINQPLQSPPPLPPPPSSPVSPPPLPLSPLPPSTPPPPLPPPPPPPLPTPPPSHCFVLFRQRVEEKNESTRRDQSNSTYTSFQTPSLTHNLFIIATSASAEVMKIIYGVCASIIIMVIGLILVCKRNVWIKRYHRRGSKFVVLKHYSIQPSVNRDDLHIPTY